MLGLGPGSTREYAYSSVSRISAGAASHPVERQKSYKSEAPKCLEIFNKVQLLPHTTHASNFSVKRQISSSSNIVQGIGQEVILAT